MPKGRSNDYKRQVNPDDEKRDVTQSVMGNENTRRLLPQVEGFSPPPKKKKKEAEKE